MTRVSSSAEGRPGEGDEGDEGGGTCATAPAFPATAARFLAPPEGGALGNRVRAYGFAYGKAGGARRSARIAAGVGVSAAVPPLSPSPPPRGSRINRHCPAVSRWTCAA